MNLILPLLVLAPLQDLDEDKADLRKIRLFVYDAARDLKLRVYDDGRVELTVRGKRYEASDAAAFWKAHPEVARRYRMDRYLEPRVSRTDFDDWWKTLRGRWPGGELDERMGDLFSLLREPRPVPDGRRFGIRVDRVGETLRDQLGLAEGEGVLVTEVTPRSIAERAGVRKFDVCVKLDSKAVADKWRFRTDILDALDREEFVLDVIHGGKRRALTVKPDR